MSAFHGKDENLEIPALHEALKTFVMLCETPGVSNESIKGFIKQIMSHVAEPQEPERVLDAKRTIGNPTEALTQFTQAMKSPTHEEMSNISRTWTKGDYHAVIREALLRYGPRE